MAQTQSSQKPKFHPIAVGNVLKKAGIPQSKYHRSGQIRGWGHSTPGFRIHTEYGEKKVRRRSKWAASMVTGTDTSVILGMKIDWRTGDWFRGDRYMEITTHLATIAEKLKAAGYKTEQVAKDAPYGGKDYYVVIEREEAVSDARDTE